MKTSRIKLMTVLIAVLLVLSVGCSTTPTTTLPSGTTSGTTESTAPTTAPTVDYSEHEEFTLWLYAAPNDYYTDYSENPVVQYLNEKFNVTLKFQQPPSGTETDALALMFGTGEYTDAIELSTYSGSWAELYDDGVIVNLADYLAYMPNLADRMAADDNFRKTVFDDDGKMLSFRSTRDETELIWGGLVYRYDILETMTGGNVQFPSGNAEPATIADWEYMLPLFKMYFEAAGMADYAPLILPYNGYFPLGAEILNGFGSHPFYYLDSGKIKFGPLDDGYYNYLKKMKEWYGAGFIYKDFASRTSDPFYLPNTSLTYGAAAGVWFGLSSQLGDAMSMPQYNLIVDVRAIPSPIDTASGQTEAHSYAKGEAYEVMGLNYAVSSTCPDIPKLVSILDYLYSEEGAMLKNFGLTKEMGAAEDPVYKAGGLVDGYYWFEGDKFTYNPILNVVGGPLNNEPFFGLRLPGFMIQKYQKTLAADLFKQADATWSKYISKTRSSLPLTLARPVDEDKTYADNNTQLMEYLSTQVPKFIMGTSALDDAAWAAFKAQLTSYGAEENIQIQQDAYDRYLQR